MIAIEEQKFGDEIWVVLRGAGAETIGWLKPDEAADLGRDLTAKYGPDRPAVKVRGEEHRL
jgi:hypothetical protein